MNILYINPSIKNNVQKFVVTVILNLNLFDTISVKNNKNKLFSIPKPFLIFFFLLLKNQQKIFTRTLR